MYAKNTTVTVARSKAEIVELVQRNGGDDVISGNLTSEGFSFVAFRLNGRNLLFKVPEPTIDDVPATSDGGRRRNLEQRKALLEQIRRARWRLLLLATKAKLELIAAGQSSVDREFLADVVVNGTHTLGDTLVPQLSDLGESAPMLPPIGGFGGRAKRR
jgi:hypothetical protein